MSGTPSSRFRKSRLVELRFECYPSLLATIIATTVAASSRRFPRVYSRPLETHCDRVATDERNDICGIRWIIAAPRKRPLRAASKRTTLECR